MVVKWYEENKITYYHRVMIGGNFPQRQTHCISRPHQEQGALILRVSGGWWYLSIEDIIINFCAVIFKKWYLSLNEVFKLEKAE